MERGKKTSNPLLIFWGTTCSILLTAYVNITPPSSVLSLVIFFLLLMMVILTITMYMGGNVRRGLMYAGGTVLYLLLRFLGLRNPLYLLFLIICIVVLEYVWKDTTV